MKISMNQKNYIGLEDFSFERFSEISQNVLKNSAELSLRLEEESAPLRDKAKKNAYLAIEMLKN